MARRSVPVLRRADSHNRLPSTITANIYNLFALNLCMLVSNMPYDLPICTSEGFEYLSLKIDKNLGNWIFAYKLGCLWATLWLIVVLLASPH